MKTATMDDHIETKVWVAGCSSVVEAFWNITQPFLKHFWAPNRPISLYASVPLPG
jgi:hypothetical protein